MVLLSFNKGFKAANKSLLLVLAVTLFNVAVNLVTAPVIKPMRDAFAPYTGPNAQKIDWSVIAPYLPQFFGLVVVFMLINLLIQSGLWACASENLKSGPAALGHFFKTGAKYFPRILGLFLLNMGALLLAVVAMLVPIMIAAVIASAFKNVQALAAVLVVVGVLAAVAVLVYAFYLLIRYFRLAPSAVVSQDKKISEAINASGSHLGKYFWPFIGLSLLYGAIYLVVFLSLVLIGVAMGAAGFYKAGATENLPMPVIAVQTTLSLVFGFIYTYIDLAAKGGSINFYLSDNAAASPQGSAEAPQA